MLTRPALTFSISLLIAVLSGATPAHADDAAHSVRALLEPDLNASFAAQPATPTTEEPAAEPGTTSSGRERRFGRAGSRWWSIGTGAATDFGDSVDVNLHGIFSQFLADELEFGIEAAGWYFNQEGQDTGGVSGSMIFRWHFAHDPEFRWSVFGDIGIGMLVGFDNVPDEGTGVNFLPRLGVGYTHVLDSAQLDGSRLTVGLRWHHISNARIEGEERNPARDSLMLYAEIQFPF